MSSFGEVLYTRLTLNTWKFLWITISFINFCSINCWWRPGLFWSRGRLFWWSFFLRWWFGRRNSSWKGSLALLAWQSLLASGMITLKLLLRLYVCLVLLFTAVLMRMLIILTRLILWRMCMRMFLICIIIIILILHNLLSILSLMMSLCLPRQLVLILIFILTICIRVGPGACVRWIYLVAFIWLLIHFIGLLSEQGLFNWI